MVVPPARVKALIAERWLAGRDIPPRLGDITLAPHQRDAAARLLDLLDEHGGAVLADEAGMGKTFTALAVACAFPGFRVVAPAALRDTWRHAMDRAGASGTFHSFEALSRACTLPDESTSLIIVDEAHHARNPSAKRYHTLARLTWGAHVLLLTATPVHNRLRDLRSQLALFLGAGANSSGADALARLVVRRGHDTAQSAARLPEVEPVRWLHTPPAPAVLRAIVELPPAVPPADGGEAHALLRLGLVRAWTSSAAALRAMLRRRLHQAVALGSALEAGRLPTRRELSAWTVLDDALQLAFPELVSDHAAAGDARALRAAIASHTDGVRRILDVLGAMDDPDAMRAAHLRWIRAQHPGARFVAFTTFADTARMLFRRLAGDGGVALVTARGARIASGAVPRAEILARLAPTHRSGDDQRLPVSLLIATDVLSEGLDLQQASVLVHLDLPWTAARLEQRLGRIRRMGSPHARVFTFAIGPPATARELRTVQRALQRKLRIVRQLVLPPGLPELEALLPPRAQTPPHGPGLAGATELVRSSLGEWCRGSAGHARPTTNGAAARPLVAVANLTASNEDWRALALVSAGTLARLVVLERDGASQYPAAILTFLGLEKHAAARSVPSHPVLRTAMRAADHWLAEQRGAATVDPVLGAPSAVHAAVLRTIDGVLARAGRHERPAVAALGARCRDLVLRARGAGAEHFLSAWLEPAPTVRGSADVAALARALEARDRGESAAGASPPRLLALYVLAPSDPPSEMAAPGPLARPRGQRYIVAPGPTSPQGTEPASGTTPPHAA